MKAIIMICAAIAMLGCAGTQAVRVVEHNAQGKNDLSALSDDELRALYKSTQKQAKEEEYQAIEQSLLEGLNNGEFPRSVALAVALEKHEELFGPSKPATKEITLYRIMLYERHEAGELTDAQVNYLEAERVNEINARIRQENAAMRQEFQAMQQRNEQRMDAEYARDSAVLQSIIYNNAMQNMLPRRPVTCNTYFNTTTCY